MKKILTVLSVLLLAAISACSGGEATQQASQTQPGQASLPSQPVQPTPQPSYPNDVSYPNDNPTTDQDSTSTTIKLEDNGKSFTFKVGDSFLLELGDEFYSWTVSFDPENIFTLKKGVMVIKGAQGVYEAFATGSTILIAGGDPLCRQVSPPCATPSIKFEINLIVE